MSLSAAASNIPLSCKVCSRRNDFSDISHLLTHISSKGHLSNYYKMKVKGSQDPASQQIIDDYDDWYEEHNLQDMMQERMAQKENKKRSSDGALVRRSSTPGLAMASVRGTPAPTSGTRRQSRLRTSTVQHVDPSLNLNSRRSQRPPTRSDTPLTGFSHNGDYFRGNDNDLPPMQNWPFSRSQSPIKQENASSEYSDASFEFDPRPTTRRHPARDQFMNGSNASVYDETIIQEMANDLSKLKGVLWPGMNMFDSATGDMKRRRNQKKHGSVLLHLQATSEETEPLEQVYRDGNLEVEREITGNPETDDNLISGESEPEPDVTEKKPARRRARIPMADKNTNTGRTMRKSERGAAHHPPFGRPTKGAYPDLDEQEEEMTFKPKKARMGLSIHRDNSGPEITFTQQPAPLNLLASGFDNQARPDALHRPAPAPPIFTYRQSNPLNVDTYAPRTHFRLPSNSWGQLNTNFRPAGYVGNLNAPSGNTGSMSSASSVVPYNSYSNAASQARSSLPQPHFGQSPSPFTHDNPLFLPETSAGDSNTWDQTMFDFNAADLNVQDMFTGTGEVSNPLFFDENDNKSDGEATISADESEN